MNAINIKKALLTASVLSLLGYVGGASAHDKAAALGAAAAAADYYKVTCYDDGEGAGDCVVLGLAVIDGDGDGGGAEGVGKRFEQKCAVAAGTGVSDDGVGDEFRITGDGGDGEGLALVGGTAADAG